MSGSSILVEHAIPLFSAEGTPKIQPNKGRTINVALTN